MAYSDEAWERAKILFELEMPLSEIESETGISKGQISKKSNKEKWGKETKRKQIKTDIVAFEKKKETLEKENETLIKEIATLNDFEITIIKDIVEKETERKSIMFSTANLSLIRKNQLLTKNSKQVIEFETTYSDEGKPLMKSPIVIDIELSPIDLKTIDEGIDKNAVSLELAPRHANQQINVNTQNNIQTNTAVLSEDEAKKKALELGVPLSALM